MKKWVIGAALLLAGCADGSDLLYNSTEAIHLALPGKPDVTCGPYKAMGDLRPETESLRACVADFQRQGYQRVQAPPK